MTPISAIIKDAVVLFGVSTVFVYVVNTAFSTLKHGAPQNDPVVTAILQNDTNAVAVLLKDSDNPRDKPDSFGRTPLLWAAYANYSTTNRVVEVDEKRAPIIRMLLQDGADVGAKDKDGWTALMWAAWSGLPQVASELLEKGAVATPADRQGNTALTLAAQRGQVDVVRLLLGKGADKTASTPAGKTALDFAKAGRDQYPARREAYTAIISLLQ